jgi:hypothetical protein
MVMRANILGKQNLIVFQGSLHAESAVARMNIIANLRDGHSDSRIVQEKEFEHQWAYQRANGRKVVQKHQPKL